MKEERNYKKEIKRLQKKSKKNKEKPIKLGAKYDYRPRWEPTWLSLDNAATIYPSIRDENWDFVFRLSAVLKEKVNKDALQKAVDDIMPRFPSFNVKLKSGLFWNYFEHQEKRLIITEEKEFPCSRFKRDDGHHIIRVIYYGHRISVECFHAVADGRSGLKFLNSLLLRYFHYVGVQASSFDGCLSHLDKPRREELQDSFFEYEDNSPKLAHKENPAYFIPGTTEDYGVINSTIGEFSVKNLKEIASKNNAKLFEFIIAVLGLSIMKRVKSTEKKPIKLSVPIDLRTYFESETLRNFSGYINIEFPINKNMQLSEAVEIVRKELKSITKERMQGFINSNVAIQKNIFIKMVPLKLKNFFINLFFKKWGESYQTLAISNLGSVSVPKELAEHIISYEANVGRPKYNAKSVGMVSLGDRLTITFSSKIKENTTERDFFTMLTSLGVEVKLYTNRRDIYA